MAHQKKFLSDTFEQVGEFGKSTAKKTGQALTQTFSPLNLVELLINPAKTETVSDKEKEEGDKRNHTPLNFEKLQENYQRQDSQRLETMRQRLFQLVKRQEEEQIQRKKQEEQLKKRQEEAKIEQQKKEEEEKKRRQQTAVIPSGKIRRSIFSRKKIAERQNVEVKPSTGKQ